MGPSLFLSEQLKKHEEVWSRLASWQSLSHEDHHRLIRLIERAYNEDPGELRAQRDRFLARLLRAIDQGDSLAFPLEEEAEEPPLGEEAEPPEVDPSPS